MWNIIRSIIYENTKKITELSMLIIVVVFSGAMLISMDGFERMEQFGVSSIAPTLALINIIFMFMVVLTSATSFNAGLENKTMNYEILYGHSRLKVYGARIITGLGFVTIKWALLVMLPVLIFTAIYGWGECCEMKYVLIRYALVLLVGFRFFAFTMIVAFAAKNAAFTGLVGYMTNFLSFFAYIFIKAIFNIDKDSVVAKYLIHIFSSTQAVGLLSFDNAQMGYIDQMDVAVYESSMDIDAMIITASIAIAAFVAYMIIGYLLFKKKDVS